MRDCDGCSAPNVAVLYITNDGRGLCRQCWAAYCKDRRAAREG